MTDLGFLEPTRSSYDAVAARYSTLFADDLPGQPVKRSLLTLFAELASGPAADVGCGPGHVTAFLRGPSSAPSSSQPPFSAGHGREVRAARRT
ncbi:hypothetical protein [Microbispora sp. ATCC PTA-5024]|uniref:hypothetical protein n=1 Tax=Microbispora sp. ATCC PTA-5024 TaxID=316330 RepID=UPI0003DD0FE2|nr:hypothetical protein [Microbispora sp. ATCC PTA-5024]ETK34889.1 hypothetical protein MPTA5024_16845 [Microbispora sp. ATCC PTA-5024]